MDRREFFKVAALAAAVAVVPKGFVRAERDRNVLTVGELQRARHVMMRETHKSQLRAVVHPSVLRDLELYA